MTITRYYVDGSSPKEKCYSSAYAVFKGEKIIVQKVITKNVNVYKIEFLALIAGLEAARKNSVIYSDNMQVVSEVNGKKDPKNEDFNLIAKILMEEKNIRIEKIWREENPAGIYLEKRLEKLKAARKEILSPRRRKKSKEDRKKIYGKKRR